MKHFLLQHPLFLAVAVGLLANPVSAAPDAFGLSITYDQQTICFTPEAVHGDALLPTSSFSDREGWSQDWRVRLKALRPAFEAQWTDWHYGNGAQSNDVVRAWENDLLRIPGNPLEFVMRCGRVPLTPYSRHGLQIIPCDADRVQLDFSSFPLPEGTFFAAGLLGASWVHNRDDVPGLHQRSLPGDQVLRKKTSPSELNEIRLTTPGSRVFAVIIQGPGINSGDLAQYGSIICVYYIPRPNQALTRLERQSTLLGNVLPGKLKFLKQNYGGRPLPVLDSLLTALMELCARITKDGEFLRGARFFDAYPVRSSWLYRAQPPDSGFPFLSEVVNVNPYNTELSSGGSPVLANLIWNAKEKGEALRRRCLERLNVDALPKELRNFLFDPNAPFSKLRFQIHIQHYMPGWKEVHDKNVPDPTQCLRPHSSVANMPFQDKKADLVNGLFAIWLCGADLQDKRNEEGTPHFTARLPPGFCLKMVNIHAGDGIKTGDKPQRMWIASPNNCQIAGTDDHTTGRSFYSVVMGKCMQYCDAYSDTRPWDDDVTAIVTLHILLPDDTEMRMHELWQGEKFINALSITFRSGRRALIPEGMPLSSAAEALHRAGEMATDDKNLFQSLYDLSH
jgi:hypothetical protein